MQVIQIKNYIKFVWRCLIKKFHCKMLSKNISIFVLLGMWCEFPYYLHYLNNKNNSNDKKREREREQFSRSTFASSHLSLKLLLTYQAPPSIHLPSLQFTKLLTWLAALQFLQFIFIPLSTNLTRIKMSRNQNTCLNEKIICFV